MPKKIAIDWDESELRLVAGQVNGASVQVTHASVISLADTSVTSALKAAVDAAGLSGTETLVGIGRGMAELRELQLPPVPDDELPDMVRFQAIRTFASAGDSATVDYLVTDRTESGIEMIAAAIGPNKLNEINKTCDGAGLTAVRVCLRPLAAASLYLTSNLASVTGAIVLIDLLASDAEIVVARNGRVIFVRTVRMPSSESARPNFLAGELKRSLVACGAGIRPEKVVLWGRSSVHANDVAMLGEASDSPVEVINPFDLVRVDDQAQETLPDHIGRLAPLVGLLAADQAHPERLIDFLQPRKRVEEEPNRYKTAALVGVPLLFAAVLGYLIYGQFQSMDAKIGELRDANASMKPSVDAAAQSIARTETVDQFLDGGVNWLSEMRRLAIQMPPSDQMIVRNISGTTDPRRGGGKLVVGGAVTDPMVIDGFETALRDESHSVIGDGANEEKTKDSYRLGVSETIAIDAESLRNQRYASILALLDENAMETEPTPQAQENAPEEATDGEPQDSKPEDSKPEDSEPEDNKPEDSETGDDEVQA